RRKRPPERATGGGTGGFNPAPRGPGQNSAFDQANVTRTRALRGILGRKLHPLTLPQQFEDGTPNRTSVEKVFDAAFIADEPESLVDEQACNCPRRHNRVLRCARRPETIPGAFRTAIEAVYEAEYRRSGARRRKSWASVGSPLGEVKGARSPFLPVSCAVKAAPR